MINPVGLLGAAVNRLCATLVAWLREVDCSDKQEASLVRKNKNGSGEKLNIDRVSDRGQQFKRLQMDIDETRKGRFCWLGASSPIPGPDPAKINFVLFQLQSPLPTPGASPLLSQTLHSLPLRLSLFSSEAQVLGSESVRRRDGQQRWCQAFLK